MELPRRYPYNPGWKTTLIGVAFFGICFAILLHAATHSRGLKFGGIHLGPDESKVVFGATTIAAGLILLGALLLALRQIAAPKIIELGTGTITLPHGFLQMRTSCIPYSKIENVAERLVQTHKFLDVKADGQTYVIIPTLFADEESYMAVRDFLISAPGSSVAETSSLPKADGCC
jgi:hypothetical protein